MSDTRNAGANIIAALRTPVATLKTCKTCGETKPIDDFSKSGKRRGVQEYRASCKLCMMTDENRKRIELRNQGMKQCTSCGQVKSLDDFYDDKRKVDGKKAVCKPCFAEQSTAYRKSESGHSVYIRAKRKYNARPEKRQRHTEYMRNVRATGRWRKQESARGALWDAILRTGFPRPTEHKCADCGEPAQEYHHESYEREHWLDVVPLCRECHRSRHSAERN